MLKKRKKFKKILLILVASINLSACKKDLPLTDDFHLWGEPICLTEDEKSVVTDNHIDYFIKHNEMLGINTCNN